MGRKFEIIAEVKTKSPFGFSSGKTWNELFKLADDVGDIVSIHTDKRWDGSFDLIEKAKGLTSKPVLAKGIHSTDDDVIKAVERGADYVLVVGRIPGVFQDKCLIEPLSLSQLSGIPETFRIVWNSRDLLNGRLKSETFEQAREIWKGWLCQASNIKSAGDVRDGADAVIVGAHLESFAASLK